MDLSEFKENLKQDLNLHKFTIGLSDSPEW